MKFLLVLATLLQYQLVSSYSLPKAEHRDLHAPAQLLRRQLNGTDPSFTASGSSASATSTSRSLVSSAGAASATGSATRTSISFASGSALASRTASASSRPSTTIGCLAPQSTSAFINGRNGLVCILTELTDAISVNPGRQCVPRGGGAECDELLTLNDPCSRISSDITASACFCTNEYYLAWQKCVKCVGIESTNTRFAQSCSDMGHAVSNSASSGTSSASESVASGSSAPRSAAGRSVSLGSSQLLVMGGTLLMGVMAGAAVI